VNRLVISTVIAGLVAGLLGAWLLQRSAASNARADARERARAFAEEYAVRVDNQIDSLLNMLRLVTTRRELSGVDPGAESELAVVLRVTPTFNELVLYNREGKPVAASASRFLAAPSDYPMRPDLKAALQSGALVQLAGGKSPLIEMTVPIENPPGVVVGALLARAPLEAATTPLDGVLAPDDPQPILVDDHGRVLVHRDRSRVISGDVMPLDTLLSHTDRAATISADGHRQILATAGSERIPAFVIAEQPESVALSTANDKLRGLLAILAVVMLAVVIAVIGAGEVLLRPLRPLISVVGRVGRGERGVRTGITGVGEIGQLAGEVDRMAEALDRREEQVGELRELSLLVGTLSEREEVARHITDGSMKLVRSDGSALCSPPSSSLTVVEATSGTMPEHHYIEDLGAGALRTGGAFRRSFDNDGTNLLAVPLAANDGERLGIIVVNRLNQPFDEEEAELLSAFASFAAVALDNARRLDLQHTLAAELQDAIDRRRDLIGTITHEFRTPLTCIEGFSSALLDGWATYSDEERRELVARIGRHGEELDDLVTKFLDFTLTERGGVSARIGPVALDEAIAEAAASLAPLLADRRVEITVPSVVVAADASLLRRTMTNLLSNAVKFSAPGSLVAVRAFVDGTRARIEVIDEGVGLTVQEAARAFEPFWRGGGATTRSTRGAGLGLALVTDYLRAMGGSCGVTSEPGQGSTFYFALPVVANEDAKTQAAS
jgi:signal transduction histidine kinase/HAMP domain-containing protein